MVQPSRPSLSSASEPPEIYSYDGSQTVQLSQHNARIASLDIACARAFRCKATDETDLEAIFITPQKSPHKAPWPTFVFVHGGPYNRFTDAFDLDCSHWAPWLNSLGYAVLGPNYRGSSGRGSAFASARRGALGTVDYDDIVCTVKAAIVEGLVDPERVMIGGFSNGGYLSYLAITREPDPTFTFKGAAGAGAGLEENVPWRIEPGDTRQKHASAIWHMQGLEKGKSMPVLILHGDDDRTVPIGQAWGFHRGLMEKGVDVEFVTYPDEGHLIDRRPHRVDMLKRLRRFVAKCIGDGEPVTTAEEGH